MMIDFPIAPRLSLVDLSAVVKIKAQATELEANGAQLVHLLRGEPDFATPAHIVQAAHAAMLAGHTQYPPPLGVRPLRLAIADRVERDFGYRPDPDREVLVTTGATMGIYIALQAIIEPGDEVILFDPSYDPYASAVRLAGGTPVAVEGESVEGHFTLPPERLEGD
jgi:aspartate aminotransferase